MNTRRVLVLVPVLLLAVLLQSAFWVPTYERQDAGNPRRLTTFVQAEIGDAKILNPILSSDGGSSQVEQFVFEGLLYVDEELNIIPRLAERWETRANAILALLPGRRLPDGTPATAPEVARRVRAAARSGGLGDLAAALESVAVLPAERRETRVSVFEAGDGEAPVEREIAVTIDVPERVELQLNRVVPDVFTRLEPLLGAAVLDPTGVEERLSVADPDDLEALRPRLDELLAVTEHNPIFVFHLRRDVRWQDGERFDAEDVKFTYEAILDPLNASPRRSAFEPIKRLEVIDPFTVRVVYKRLFSPAIVEWVYMDMIPEHRLNAEALAREMDRRGITGEARQSFGLRQSDSIFRPIGTGPYRLSEWRRDEFLHLTRDDEYWKQLPEYRDLFLRVVPELVTQELEFTSGAVDRYGAQPHQVARYREDDRYQAISSVRGYYAYIGYNLRRPLFRDVRVRRALGMAINVDDLIQYVLYGEAQRTSGPYYRNQRYYDPDTPLLPYDPEGAKALLAEAGWTPGPDGILQKDGERLAFKLITNNGNPQRKAILTIAQDAWKRIGIDVRTQAFEWTVFLEDFVNKNEFDAVVLAWGGGELSPDLYQIWHSSQTVPYHLNHVGYEDPRADALIERIREEYDPEVQVELAHQLHSLIAEAQPMTFLYAPTSTLVLDKKIVIVERDPAAPGGERYSQIRPVKSGDVTYHFERWRKLPAAIPFQAEF